ncbi:predicted protein [Uncinocarpus reesii 1704]|uniref:Uncharacterized protein n=1 Tax=Uncinocarpus reesii (strain UAMH 1704) TaxID=336963 RepID=C4JG97_UNCRE|nr:uncharacterized protein UREG_02495 [Uncinocarpus reesii 1704]EEP77646.1 predicted protein [Uncinocarpus reesii 1704]
MIIKRDRSGAQSTDIIVGGVVVLAVLCLTILIFLILRTLRIRNYEPRFLPTNFLKRKWKSWNPRSTAYGQVPPGSTPATEQVGTSAIDQSQSTAYQGSGSAHTEAAQVAIDRNTSIRSIMTLPAYSPSPKPSEQVIGREGERGGMDVVVEFPETVDEEENRREQEMESLYQIRLARRREIAEREERRRQRREARERGDRVLLERLRAESRARTETRANDRESTSAASLLAEHRSRGRDRRVSSVSYADVGHVRHDGSRVRASSQGSDSRPLLDTAASMGQDGNGHLGMHHRTFSGTSILSQSTVSDMDNSGTPGTDIGDSTISNPPPYEHLDLDEAPPYSDVPQDSSRPAEPPSNSTVPSIAVETATPPPSTPSSPVSPRRNFASAST